MKKVNYVYLGLVVSFFNSCGNMADQRAREIADSLARVDSIYAAEYAIWQNDSIEIANRNTYDLTFCEVHGPVHVITDSHDLLYVFDKNGTLIEYCGYDPFKSYPDNFENLKTHFERDNKGRIAEWLDWEAGGSWIWDGDILIKEEWYVNCYTGNAVRSYDENGYLIEETTTKADCEDEDNAETTITRYTYIDFDKYGNWIKRKVGEETETRTITYYPVDNPFNPSKVFDPEHNEYVFSGKIGADTGCLLEFGHDGGYYTVSNGKRSARFNSYDESNAILIVDAYAHNSEKYIGSFSGEFSMAQRTYKGTFTNANGGQVSFDLRLI